MRRLIVLLVLLIPLIAQSHPAGSYVGEIAPGVTLVLREKLPPEEWPTDLPGDYVLGGFIFDNPDSTLVLGDLWIDYDEWEIPVRYVLLIPVGRYYNREVIGSSVWYTPRVKDALGLHNGFRPDGKWLQTRRSRAVLAYFVCPLGSLPRPEAGTTWGYRKPNAVVNAVVMEGGGIDVHGPSSAP